VPAFPVKKILSPVSVIKLNASSNISFFSTCIVGCLILYSKILPHIAAFGKASAFIFQNINKTQGNFTIDTISPAATSSTQTNTVVLRNNFI
jgi:hypothetical protein